MYVFKIIHQIFNNMSFYFNHNRTFQIINMGFIFLRHDCKLIIKQLLVIVAVVGHQW